MSKFNAMVDYEKKEIEVSKDFLKKAGQFGTPEFYEVLEMKKDLPGFTLVERKIKRNLEKQSYGDLTYKKMVEFIKGHEEDGEKRKAKLEEFKTLREWAKTQRSAAYAKVK